MPTPRNLRYCVDLLQVEATENELQRFLNQSVYLRGLVNGQIEPILKLLTVSELRSIALIFSPTRFDGVF